MNAIQKMWTDLMDIPYAGWIVGVTGLVVLCLFGYYVLSILRGMATGGGNEPINLLSEFQKLKSEGKLSDEEFKQVKELTPIPNPGNSTDKPETNSNKPTATDGAPVFEETNDS